jgi:hypothetical protein
MKRAAGKRRRPLTQQQRLADLRVALRDVQQLRGAREATVRPATSTAFSALSAGILRFEVVGRKMASEGKGRRFYRAATALHEGLRGMARADESIGPIGPIGPGGAQRCKRAKNWPLDDFQTSQNPEEARKEARQATPVLG